MKTILAVVVLLLCARPVGASVSGSIGFDTPTLVQADASPTGNINTAAMFDLEGLASTNNTSGVFEGLPIQSFGDVLFSPIVGASFKLSDGPFGSFASHSIGVIVSSPGFLNLLLAGRWTPGTFHPGVICPALGCDAVFRISMTQTPAVDGEISMSGTMSTNALAVLPEPSTWLLFLTGMGMVLVGAKLRAWWV